MYELAKLCQRIDMPQPVTEILLSQEPGEEALGFPVLKEHLLRAYQCWEEYQRLGLSEEIYIDTMACFSRFVREYHQGFGVYGFDRGFWTTRQTGARLFRIGELEYELDGEDDAVSLHIPSDAALETSQLRASWEQAKAILESPFPEWAGKPWICHSWLLSPDLKALLPENARILKFQQSFTIEQREDDGEVKPWVFYRDDTPIPELPEHTTLQRNLKAYLLAGNAFHSGAGTLREQPFQ